MTKLILQFTNYSPELLLSNNNTQITAITSNKENIVELLQELLKKIGISSNPDIFELVNSSISSFSSLDLYADFELNENGFDLKHSMERFLEKNYPSLKFARNNEFSTELNDELALNFAGDILATILDLFFSLIVAKTAQSVIDLGIDKIELDNTTEFPGFRAFATREFLKLDLALI